MIVVIQITFNLDENARHSAIQTEVRLQLLGEETEHASSTKNVGREGESIPHRSRQVRTIYYEREIQNHSNFNSFINST